MKTRLFKMIYTIVVMYIILLGLLFVFQERLIFFPQKLGKNYEFRFRERFEEIFVESTDGKLIHGLLFKADKPKGLIFYLHGNAGSLKSWGEIASTYTDLDYDIFIVDYRGYGKSQGRIQGQDQLFEDNQLVYNELKKRYSEDEIIILGYSIGAALAAKLASTNYPKLLILKAPFYSLADLVKHYYKIIPTFLLRYELPTYEYLRDCQMPVIIFHGDRDEVIYYGSSIKLKEEFKPDDTLITLDGQRHNGITENEQYRAELEKVLGEY
jgi:uncharacterized protein